MTAAELDTVSDARIDLLPPARPAAAAAVAMLRDHAEMMNTAHQLAVAMCGTQMVPLRFHSKPDDGAAAILYGAELGLNPIQSLQRVIPIHGMPTIEARTMVALLKARGYAVKTVAQSDESVTVRGLDLDGEVYESTWTIERAVKAGYAPTVDEKTGRHRVNGNGKLIGNAKYLTDPQAMLKAKAQAEVCRDMAPDVLLGIAYSREELESEQFDDEPARRSRTPVVRDVVDSTADWKPTGALDGKIKPAPTAAAGHDDDGAPGATVVVDAEVDAEPTWRDKWFLRLGELLTDADCVNAEDQLTVIAKIARTADLLDVSAVTDAQLRTVVNQLDKWSNAGELAQQITEILNLATLADDAEETTG